MVSKMPSFDMPPQHGLLRPRGGMPVSFSFQRFLRLDPDQAQVFLKDLRAIEPDDDRAQDAVPVDEE
jgi:hypothetical protein